MYLFMLYELIYTFCSVQLTYKNMASINPIQYILWSPKSQITNSPQSALQSVHIQHP